MNYSFKAFGPLFLGILVIILSSCTTHRTEPTPPPSQAELAQNNIQQGQYERAAQHYLKAAEQQRTYHYRLLAAIAYLQADNTKDSARVLSQINSKKLDNRDFERWRITKRLLKARSLPTVKALAHIDLPADDTPDPMGQLTWKTRAQVLLDENEYVPAVHNLVKRGLWLKTQRLVNQNNDWIFELSLKAVEKNPNLDLDDVDSIYSTTQGWLALAQLKNQDFPSSKAKKRALQHWHVEYPNHPASPRIVKKVFDEDAPIASKKVHLGHGPIILALPFSGRLAEVSKAIELGFSTQFNTLSQHALEVVDSRQLSMQKLAAQAAGRDAAMIVGPLTKDKVKQLARLMPQIPVIALNNATDNPPDRFYQFALAPEAEAQTIAQHALAKQQTNALVLAPNSNYGQRIYRAFKDTFEGQQGRVLARAYYSPNEYDHQDTIKRLLAGGKLKRADFIFIVAPPDQARIIRSQLKYYRAEKLPVYATSKVYKPNQDTAYSSDLNGLQFTTIPWLINQNLGSQIVSHSQIENAKTSSQKLAPPLIAMGVDAAQLAKHLLDNQLTTGIQIIGATGKLRLNNSGQIERQLSWAEFRRGRVHALQNQHIKHAPPHTTQENSQTEATESFGPVL